jgi:beta-lactamase class A
MPRRQCWQVKITVMLATSAVFVWILTIGALAGPTPVSAAVPVCTSTRHPVLAARMSAHIEAAVMGRTSRLGIHVDDPSLKLHCSLNADDDFYAASTVKVLILAALLHKAEVHNRALTPAEQVEARKMITVSNNYAAGELWYDVRRKALHDFLNLAGMSETILGSGANWGLTLETARDESLLLHLLLTPNSILTTSDREYELNLMADVVSTQRWGTPAGLAPDYIVHVKNGWIAQSGYKWVINSLGAFTETGHDYTMDVLTDHNATMAYGVTTIENIALAVHHDIGSVSGN